MFGSLFSAHKDVRQFNPGEERWEVIGDLGVTGLPAISAYRFTSTHDMEQVLAQLRIVDTGETRTVVSEERKIINVEVLVPADTSLVVTVVS